MISAKPLPEKQKQIKPRRTLLTDPAEIKILTSCRWKEGMPLTWREGDSVCAQSDVLKEWRAKQTAKAGVS